MRLPPIAPRDLTGEQQALYDDLRRGMGDRFSAFKVNREDGAFIGPWNPYLHEPAIGRTTWDLTHAIDQLNTLSRSVREVAILVVGARYKASYLIYAHVAIGEAAGRPVASLATMAAALKPTGLSADESIGYDIACSLTAGSTLPESLYRLGVGTFGQRGMHELIYLVGLYSMLAVTLNAFDVPVPGCDDSVSS